MLLYTNIYFYYALSGLGQFFNNEIIQAKVSLQTAFHVQNISGTSGQKALIDRRILNELSTETHASRLGRNWKYIWGYTGRLYNESKRFATALNKTKYALALNKTGYAPALNKTKYASALNMMAYAPALNKTENTPALKRTQNITAMNMTEKAMYINLIKKFKTACEAYNITYLLDGGSVLGVYMYNGFLPWDDDFDGKVNVSQKNILKKALEDIPGYALFSRNNTVWKYVSG